jgi:FlaA1/EpsC-like NDP-sugar epimerase
MDLVSFYRGKTVLITGGTGTVGAELARQLLQLGAAEVRLLDHNESAIFLVFERNRSDDRIRPFVGDVRDAGKLRRVMHGCDVVFHAAALKHVYLGEFNPFDIVQTNILGVQNVIEAALEEEVDHVVFTSSDKAVNPTNVMGTSKLMGERLMTAAQSMRGSHRATFASTRFGNVVGSAGSVVPLFAEQIRDGGPVTLTDRRMTRFMMTIQEAAELVLKAAPLAKGGEVFVTKMPVIRIADLARVMVEALAPAYGHAQEAVEIVEIGSKPGEKLYEELMSDEETRRALELDEQFVILPAIQANYKEERLTSYPGLISTEVDRPYVSEAEPTLDRDAVRAFLKSCHCLHPDHIPPVAHASA